MTVDEAARVLRLSPARIRQMLRSGELAGERQASRVEGGLGGLEGRLEAAEIQESALREGPAERRRAPTGWKRSCERSSPGGETAAAGAGCWAAKSPGSL